MAKTRTARIEEIQNEIEQLEKRQKALIQQQKEQDRKDRTKRLCKRMGLFESLLPEAVPLTDEQFKTFLERAVATEDNRKMLTAIAAQAGGAGTTETAETEAQAKTMPGVNPSGTGQVHGAAAGVITPESAPAGG